MNLGIVYGIVLLPFLHPSWVNPRIHHTIGDGLYQLFHLKLGEVYGIGLTRFTFNKPSCIHIICIYIYIYHIYIYIYHIYTYIHIYHIYIYICIYIIEQWPTTKPISWSAASADKGITWPQAKTPTCCAHPKGHSQVSNRGGWSFCCGCSAPWMKSEKLGTFKDWFKDVEWVC